jgi:hypothetical protein
MIAPDVRKEQAKAGNAIPNDIFHNEPSQKGVKSECKLEFYASANGHADCMFQFLDL